MLTLVNIAVKQELSIVIRAAHVHGAFRALFLLVCKVPKWEEATVYERI